MQFQGILPYLKSGQAWDHARNRRKWMSFVDIHKFGAPASVSQGLGRLQANILGYPFQYSGFFLLVLLLVMQVHSCVSYSHRITHPYILAMFCAIGGCFVGMLRLWPPQGPLGLLQGRLIVSWQAALTLWAAVSLLAILGSGTWLYILLAVGIFFILGGSHGIFHQVHTNFIGLISLE